MEDGRSPPCSRKVFLLGESYSAGAGIIRKTTPEQEDRAGTGVMRVAIVWVPGNRRGEREGKKVARRDAGHSHQKTSSQQGVDRRDAVHSPFQERKTAPEQGELATTIEVLAGDETEFIIDKDGQ